MREDVLTRESASSGMLRTGYTFNTVVLNSTDKDALRLILEQKTRDNPELYEGSPLVLDVSLIKSPENLDFQDLQDLCRQFNMFLIGFSGLISEELALKIQQKGIPVVNSNRYARIREENFKPRVVTKTLEIKVPYKIEVPVPVTVNGAPMQVIRRNIRSGELISVNDNSVMIIGNVSPAARIIASHHVLVVGDIAGEIYAGSPKSSDDHGCAAAMVFNFGTFSPTLVAIAGNYQTADDILNNEDAKNFYDHRGSLMVSLQGKSLRYCALTATSLNNHLKK